MSTILIVVTPMLKVSLSPTHCTMSMQDIIIATLAHPIVKINPYR